MQKTLEPRSRITPRIIAPQAAEEGDLDVLAVLRTLWRGKWLLALLGFLGLVWGWYNAYVFETPLYRATATLAVEVRAEQVVDLGTIINGVSGDEYEMNTEMTLIRSRELVGRVVDELGLVNDPEFNGYLQTEPEFSLRQAPRDFLRWLAGKAPAEPAGLPDLETQRQATIGAVAGAYDTALQEWSYIFYISATSEDPAKAGVLANTLARVYRDDQIAQKVQATERAAIWLSERVSELRADLDRRQIEINNLRAESLLVTDEAISSLNAQAVTIETDLAIARRQYDEAQAKVVAIAAAAPEDFAARAAALGDLQLIDLAQTAATNPMNRQRFERRFEQLRLQVEGDVTRLSGLLADLEERADRLSAQIAATGTDLARIRQLEEEAEATRVLYETFLTRLKETSLQVGIHQADSRILSEAGRGSYVSPRKTRIMAIWLLAGLALGAALVLVREFLQNTYRTADDLEKSTGRTVLGQIPRIPAKGRAGTIAYLADKPTSAAAEAIRNLRTSVLLSNVDDPPKVILSTSSIPGEGKTTLAIALAQNLAGLDKKVLLIEGDIRRRTFTNYFPEAARNAGLLSVISQRVPLAEAVWRHPRLKIDALMGEKSSINAADVFSSESFRALIRDMRAAYDYVVIDTPPVLVVPDARVIATQADAVIYTVKWDRTTKGQVDEGLKQLQNVNIHVTGLVLSQIDPRGMRRYGYGNHYGAYSRYAKGYYDA